jgi:hydroxyacylglutathione hydrolase
MNLLALPAFDDNCIRMLHDGQAAVVVDPGDAAPVFAALERPSPRLAGILVTHHHGDHVGGLAALPGDTAQPDRAGASDQPFSAQPREHAVVETARERGADAHAWKNTYR